MAESLNEEKKIEEVEKLEIKQAEVIEYTKEKHQSNIDEQYLQHYMEETRSQNSNNVPEINLGNISKQQPFDENQ